MPYRKSVIAESQLSVEKTISKPKSKKKPEPKKFNVDLVEFMRKMYARIIVDICAYRKHDEDSGCDIDCVGTKIISDYDYKGNKVSIIYLPVSGDTWCEDAVFYVNFPEKVNFTDSTITKCKIEFEKIRELLVNNFNEIREKAGGRWGHEIKTPINPRHILGLYYDLYFRKDDNGWKLKFKPGTDIGAPDGGRWIPHDVEKIFEENQCDTKEQKITLYADMYKHYGFLVPPAVIYKCFLHNSIVIKAVACKGIARIKAK